MYTIGVKFDKQNDIISSAFELMKRHSGLYLIEEENRDADFFVALFLEKNMEKESYRIEKTDDAHISVYGADFLGLVYGIGRMLHKGMEEIKDEQCTPKKHIRAVYYATHFGNFYQSAPIEEVIHHMEEQMLWGCNCIAMWFDMHHFCGIDDPAAKKLLFRIRDVFSVAKSMGMKTSLTMLANEYYCGAPENLLAQNSTEGTGYTKKMVGFYGTEICPSSVEGEALIISARRKMLEFFKDTKLDFLLLWPYDQGGCTCSQCRPWGGKGFLEISKELSVLLREFFPEAKCILSAWRFDDFTTGEWDILLKELNHLREYFDFIMADFAASETPEELHQYVKKAGMGLVGFPDISMLATPWGGFGAAPATKHLNGVFEKNELNADGGFCYSEGIFEDINKALMLSLYMGNSTREDVIRDYFRFYFGENTVEYAPELIDGLEETLPRHRIGADGVINDYPFGETSDRLPVFEIKNKASVKRVREIAETLYCRVSDTVRESPRFLMLYLRAVIDFELEKNQGNITDAIEEAAQRLKQIYYAEQADYVVSPITKKAIRENKGLI